MSEIARIEDQLKRAFEGEAWHGPSIRELLTNVTAEMAATKPLTGAHSIWEIVHHVTAWQEGVRRRLEGHVVELSPEEDWPPVGDTSLAAWGHSLEALNHGHERLRSALARLSDSQLEDGVPGKDYSVYFMLHGIIQHTLYHAGQIAILKRAWS
jgi:uncharacterized damage-inducible protein DinB